MSEERSSKPKDLKGGPRRLSRLSLGFLVVTLLLIGLGVMTLLKAPPPGGRENAFRPGFDLQGHRGARGLYPENTMEGFAQTLALGVTTLEMDVVMTADGILVLHHDLRLDPDHTRTASGAWIEEPGAAIKTLTLAQLGGYDVGGYREDSKDARRFPDQQPVAGARIASLASVLERMEEQSGSRVRYNIELKTSPIQPEVSSDPTAGAAKLVSLIREMQLAERAEVQSFDWRTLLEVERLAPEIDTVFLTAEQDWLDTLQRGRPGASPWLAGHDLDKGPVTPPQAIKELGGSVWSPYFRDLRPADLDEAHRLGLRVVVWTVNDPEDMRNLIEVGVDGIITDYPDRLRQVLVDMGRDPPPRFP